eukprot:scpid59364/ scgid31652/ 
MAASFPSDYFSYEDFDYEPDTPDCGDPWEDMESFINHIDESDDEMVDRIMMDDSLFSDFFDDVFENALDEQMNIIPSIFLRICENPKYGGICSSYTNNHLLEKFQDDIDEYL